MWHAQNATHSLLVSKQLLSLQFSGHIYMNATGTWSFSISSDDGSILYIDGRCLINNNGTVVHVH